VLKTFLTLSSGEAVARGLHALAILWLVRALKPDSFGVFELALSITSYAVLAVQQGFDTVAIRGISSDTGSAGSWLWRVVRLRLRFVVPVLALLLAAGLWHRDNALGILLLALSGSAVAGALTPRFVFLGLEQARQPAIASVLTQAIFLTAVAAFVRTPEHGLRAALGWVAGEAAAAALLWWLLPRGGRTPAPVAGYGPLLRESWPITLTLLLSQITYNFDVLALGLLGRRAEIGYYLAAYRCITVFWPLMLQFQASLLPRMVRWQVGGRALEERARAVAWLSVSPAVLASLGLFAVAPVLVQQLFGQAYQPAIFYLRILAWLLPLQVVRLIGRQVLVARGQQSSDTWTTASGAITNMAVDLALIPRYGAMGCAVSALCAAAVMALSNWLRATRSPAATPPSGESLR
jgi:O-antigen/teichoic acid export membrane protein